MEPATEAARDKGVFVLNRAKLDELCKANGIDTDAELAKIIRCSPVTLWRVRQGEVYPSSGFIANTLLAFPHVDWKLLFTLAVVSERAAA